MASRIVPEGGHRLKPFRTPRVKKPGHLAFVKKLICVCCAVAGLTVQADDPAHVRCGDELYGKEITGAGTKPSDFWTVPLCRRHHDAQHDEGSEVSFWKFYRVDPHLLALVLWAHTGDEHACNQVILAHAAVARGRRWRGRRRRCPTAPPA